MAGGVGGGTDAADAARERDGVCRRLCEGDGTAVASFGSEGRAASLRGVTTGDAVADEDADARVEDAAEELLRRERGAAAAVAGVEGCSGTTGVAAGVTGACHSCAGAQNQNGATSKNELFHFHLSLLFS